jgi:hypothetical protein
MTLSLFTQRKSLKQLGSKPYSTPQRVLKLHVGVGEVKLCSEGESEDRKEENRVLLIGVREGARSCYE